MKNMEAQASEPLSKNTESTADHDSTEITSLWKLAPVTVALCTTLFCVSLDATIIATAIPKITTYFDSLNDVAWYGSSYIFTTSAMQLIFGKLYTFYPSKWVFLAGLLVFEIGSLICAVAPTSNALIVGRCIAGLGGAGLFSGCLIIVATTVPLRIRPIYMGLVSSMHAIASVAGPLMGGALTDHLSWRWCFYINLPFGGLGLFCILIFLPSNADSIQRVDWKTQLRQFDLPGTIFLIPSIICLIFALQWGGSLYAWDSARIIALFVVSGVTFGVFLGIQVWQKDQATIPIRLMRNRNVWGAAWYGSCISSTSFIFTYYLPIWFQAIKDKSATDSGIANLPSLISMVLFAIIGGILASAIGYYTPLLLVSSVLTSIGGGLLSCLEVDSNIGHWFGYQVLMNAGVGVGAQNALLVASVAVAPADLAMTTSILTFVQTLSSAILLPIGQSVFQNQLSANLISYLPDVDVALILHSGATGFRDHLKSNQLPLALQAYNKALCQTFYVGVATAALSILGPIFMEWLSLKPQVEAKKDDQSSKSSIDEPTQMNSEDKPTESV
ncbi:unnamed protein product [Penicillium salamii]|uniref:Major facilitator superfamily (MFS) profile domain-containing protein n=1 Tax=Penicillium salamii TaxID=1612424 RepID=A0A9W4N1E6_9EURO|nr:unnamed protein product [Penicillium salamii]CAG8272293.1 unnamed protein product [Penicillium salamii]CAG8379794.1 unnamed protein product [Penicillium salamii]CAG8380628.1 unnamed protein product [Penicillium salamii]